MNGTLQSNRTPRPIVDLPTQCHHCLVTVDGKLLLTVQEHPEIRVAVWEVGTGRLCGELEPPRDRISLLVAPARATLSGRCSDGNIYVLELRTRKLVRTLALTNRECAISTRRPTVARWPVPAADHQVRLWDVADGGAAAAQADPSCRHMVRCLLPDEYLVATGDASGTARIWSLTTGKELLVLAQLDGAVDRMTILTRRPLAGGGIQREPGTGFIFGKRQS